MIYSSQLPLYEYNLRITIPDPVYSQIRTMKSEFIRFFGPGLYSRSQPYITVANFCMDPKLELKLLNHLHQVLSNQAFRVSFQRVSGFEDIKMVVLDVDHNTTLLDQVRGLQGVFNQELRIPSKYASVVDRFHIAIGQASNSLDYGKAIQLLNILPLDREFTTTDYVLVKRPMGKQVPWQECNTFHLGMTEAVVA